MNPNNQLSVIFKRAIDFVSNGNLMTGTFMTMEQCKNYYPLFVFDLTKQENLKADLKLQFKYILSGPIVGEKYSWRSMIISEGNITVDNIQDRASISMN